MLSEWMVGTWMLEEQTVTDKNGVVSYPMGEDVQGFLCYTADGWMSVQIMKPNRERFKIPTMDGGTTEQIAEAAKGLSAYAGPFEVDEENKRVYHHVAFALVPNWIGKTMTRDIVQEDGEKLVLSVYDKHVDELIRLRWARRKA